MVAGRRRIALAALAVAASLTALHSAELPSQYNQHKKSKPPAAAKQCNIGGSAGVRAANGVCVRLSGYVSTSFTAGGPK